MRQQPGRTGPRECQLQLTAHEECLTLQLVMMVVVGKRDGLHRETHFLSGWSVLLVIRRVVRVQTQKVNFLIDVQVPVTSSMTGYVAWCAYIYTSVTIKSQEKAYNIKGKYTLLLAMNNLNGDSNFGLSFFLPLINK